MLIATCFPRQSLHVDGAVHARVLVRGAEVRVGSRHGEGRGHGLANGIEELGVGDGLHVDPIRRRVKDDVVRDAVHIGPHHGVPGVDGQVLWGVDHLPGGVAANLHGDVGAPLLRGGVVCDGDGILHGGGLQQLAEGEPPAPLFLLLAKLVATDGLGEHPAVLLLGHVLRARQALCVHRLAARLGGHCGVVIPAAGAVTGDHALDGVVGVGDESLGRVHQVLGPGLDPVPNVGQEPGGGVDRARYPIGDIVVANPADPIGHALQHLGRRVDDGLHASGYGTHHVLKAVKLLEPPPPVVGAALIVVIAPHRIPLSRTELLHGDPGGASEALRGGCHAAGGYGALLSAVGDRALDGVVGVGDESLGPVHQVLRPRLDPVPKALQRVGGRVDGGLHAFGYGTHHVLKAVKLLEPPPPVVGAAVIAPHGTLSRAVL
eukprot:CAMPEP_0197503890 /NCGR_PEP_ID=MMETSP1312-20131121/3037_1 /TAXON_ID=464262 /ORGANISM="Genus nov. species nov., Strain RCC2335" /LENGTH=431 /DNA_ID=CAMNT_0043050651 /DNA_START=161 /DNA_END=1453 /DNA_ORIENTATION=+